MGNLDGIKKSIDAGLFIKQLDACFDKNDRRAAKECIARWENAARQAGDDRGLLTVLNEAVGFYRREKKKSRALEKMEESLSLSEKLALSGTLSGATVYINAATTLSFFGEEEKGLELYSKADRVFKELGAENSYEYASLLNNRAGVLYGQKRYCEAEKDWLRAVDILKRIGSHDGEAAVSLVMLAHLTFDRDGDGKNAEKLLDRAWEYLNADVGPRDGNYAYVINKCAPSFDYFDRPMEAQALRDVAKEIYSKD